MIKPEWRRIAAIHVQDDGTIGAVWLAWDRDADTLHVYDCALFRREVLAVVAEGLNARGRWIPIAWEEKSKATADKLLDRGCKMAVEGVKDDPLAAEMVSRDVWERMRTGRLRVERRLAEWLDEYQSFYAQDSEIPKEKHPLMSATRHAVASLDEAKAQASARPARKNYPEIAMI